MDERAAAMEQAFREAEKVIDNVSGDQLATTTPCTEWDVQAIIHHMVRGNQFLAARFSGSPSPSSPDMPLGPDYKEEFRSSARAVLKAIGQEGVLDREYDHPIFGKQQGSFLLNVRVFDTLTHTWDIACATAQSRDIAPEMTEQALTVLRSTLAGVPRTGNPFGPEQEPPTESTPADRLAAFLGRAVPA